MSSLTSVCPHPSVSTAETESDGACWASIAGAASIISALRAIQPGHQIGLPARLRCLFWRSRRP